jgi:hypothetical protein
MAFLKPIQDLQVSVMSNENAERTMYFSLDMPSNTNARNKGTKIQFLKGQQKITDYVEIRYFSG